MRVNFFDVSCQETPRIEAEFGLCDNRDGSKAYTNIDTPEIWTATVKNNNNRSIIFTPIYEYKFISKNTLKEQSCEGMLRTADTLYFVELKSKSGYIPDAIGQLESTINIFIKNHDVNAFRFRKAFACRKYHYRFNTFLNEFNCKFNRAAKFRIDIQCEIIIK